MAWVEVHDYNANGWERNLSPADQARVYCSELEKGGILFFSNPPFAFPTEDWRFLVSLKPADSRLHKNISYRPETRVLRGFEESESRDRVDRIMREYSERVREFVSDFLAPYAGRVQMDYASFRP